MILRVQHIAKLFTFLAGLIILAHAIVPHHHHFELTHSSDNELTCESTANCKNNENRDAHCHVFNILVSGTISKSTFNNSSSEYFSYFLFGIFSNFEIQPVKNLLSTIFDHQIIFLKQFFFTAQSFRAPPAIT
jgi:hypothetical protein